MGGPSRATLHCLQGASGGAGTKTKSPPDGGRRPCFHDGDRPRWAVPDNSLCCPYFETQSGSQFGQHAAPPGMGRDGVFPHPWELGELTETANRGFVNGVLFANGRGLWLVSLLVTSTTLSLLTCRYAPRSRAAGVGRDGVVAVVSAVLVGAADHARVMVVRRAGDGARIAERGRSDGASL